MFRRGKLVIIKLVGLVEGEGGAVVTPVPSGAARALLVCWELGGVRVHPLCKRRLINPSSW